MTSEEKIARIGERLGRARYSNISQAGRVHALTAAITACAQRKGQAMPGHAAESTAAALDAELDRYFGRELAFAEVMLALDWGTHREFGEFSGINVDRMFDFVRMYRNCPERQEAASRLKSFAAPQAGRRPRTNAEIGRLNWESGRRYAMKAYGDFCETGSLPGTEVGKGGVSRALVIAQRHNEANTYRWLKKVGIIAEDERTAGTEAEAAKEAQRRLRKAGDEPGWEQVKTLAEALMLQAFFATVRKSGFDFKGAMDGVSDIPEEDRLFW